MTASTFFSGLEPGAAALDGEGLPKRIVAISDIHGVAASFDCLVAGLTEIDTFADAAFYILGDMVDRGPNSRGVIDRVIALMQRRPGSRTFIGNHDLWFQQFLNGGMEDDDIWTWIMQGGAETLRSYGVDDGDLVETARRHIFDIAPDHSAFLDRSERIALVGDFAFVHAGVDPNKPLDRQSRYECAWIRAPFMRYEGRLSHVVVHGHTPQKRHRPTVTENRISIDTGAVYGGVLTAALIDREDRTLGFVATDGSDVFAIEPQILDRGHGTIIDSYPASARSSR